MLLVGALYGCGDDTGLLRGCGVDTGVLQACCDVAGDGLDIGAGETGVGALLGIAGSTTLFL